MLLDEVLERDAHLLLDDARVVHVPRYAEQLRALIPRAPEPGEPRRPAPADRRGDRDRLDVRDRRRAAEEADVSGEWGLEARLALLALEGLDERGLLPTDVRPSAAVEVDVERVSGAARVLAEVAGLVPR